MMLYLLLLAGAGHGLVPTSLYPGCLNNPRIMTGDPDNCHIFYQCEINPAPMSCGDMMFNTDTQVCDWPHRVIQIRQECRRIEQVVLHNSLETMPFLQRTVRMLSHYDSPASSGDPQRDELTRRIFLEIQRRLPGLLNRKITNYISSRNTVHDVVENDVVNDVYEDRYQDDYSEERQESEDFYENHDYNNYVPVVASTQSTTTTTTTTAMTTTPATTTTTPPPTRSTVRTILTFNTAALPRLRRPQPTPFHQIPKSLETGHYTYSHQYTSQVTDTQIDADSGEPIVASEVPVTTTTRSAPSTTHTFTSDPQNSRRWNVSRKRPFLRNCARGGNCPKPRRLILRKVRRKLFQNERDRLQERRNELRSDSEYDIYTNDLRTEAPEVRQGGNGIEAAQEENSQQGYAGDSAIEKLKSLIREKQFANEKLSNERSGKIVSVSFSTSTS